MLLVNDVRQSTAWYRQLLDARNDHNRDEFDQILATDGTLLLMLHHADAREHGSAKPSSGHPADGIIVWFYVFSLEQTYKRAVQLEADIIAEPKENTQAGWREFTVRDPDGYLLAFVEII